MLTKEKNNTFSQTVKQDLKIIGWYQIIGGLSGFIIVAKGLSNGIYYGNIDKFLYSLVSLFFLFSVLSGWFCIRANKNAIAFSTINQYLQVIYFSSKGTTYCYLAGAYIVAGFDITESFHIFFDYGLAKIQLFFNSEPELIFFAVNFPALLFIYWLNRLRKHVKFEISLNEADSIGEEQQPVNN